MENVGLAQRLGGDGGVCQVGSKRRAFQVEKRFSTPDSAAHVECPRASEAGVAAGVSKAGQDRMEDGRGPGSEMEKPCRIISKGVSMSDFCFKRITRAALLRGRGRSSKAWQSVQVRCWWLGAGEQSFCASLSVLPMDPRAENMLPSPLGL